VLDSGAVSRLAERSRRAAGLLTVLKRTGQWPLVIPSPVLVECLRGDPRRDAATNRFLKSCKIEVHLQVARARRAAELRRLAGRGSAVDAIVVATAEPNGTVYTGDEADIRALAAHAVGVVVRAL
jgi:predicted nucleic acid-binding protein